MTTLRDPFATVHKKPLKNKQGVVVAELDYVGWSQSADRLDEVVPDGWSFAIIATGTDWVHGRLTIGDRHFENIGYAENAEADWKKEVLKDATSDAFKRCAALAGVARYLYDKDAPSSGTSPRTPPQRPVAPAAAARPHLVDTDVLEPSEEDVDALFAQAHSRADLVRCPIHDIPWNGTPGDLYHRKGEGGFCRHPDNVKTVRAK